MPSRKQRRRRQKGRRHEYEYVYVDDEGHEVAVEEVEPPQPKPRPERTAQRDPNARPGSQRAKPRTAQQASRFREVKPASWDRVFKRAALFAPLMLLVVSLLGKDLSWQSRILQTLLLLVFFIPFSYFMDQAMYRSYRKRIGDPLPPKTRAPKSPKDDG